MNIGDKVFLRGELCTILGFTKDMYTCVVQCSTSTGHSGINPSYWYDKEGNVIPYIPGQKRYYVSLEALKECWEINKWYEFKMNVPTDLIQIAKITEIDGEYLHFNPWIVNSNELHGTGGVTKIKYAEPIRELKEEDECIQKFFSVEQKKAPPIPELPPKENTIGRYIKALIDRPDGGLVKKGEIGVIVGERRVDFPSQKGYNLSKSKSDRYELMPKSYVPIVNYKESLVGRYVKALVNYPNAGVVKKGEIGIIIEEYTADFPSQKAYYLQEDWEGKYELMPIDYSPMEIIKSPCSKDFVVSYGYLHEPEFSSLPTEELVLSEITGLKDKLLDTSVKSIKSIEELFFKPTIYLF